MKTHCKDCCFTSEAGCQIGRFKYVPPYKVVKEDEGWVISDHRCMYARLPSWLDRPIEEAEQKAYDEVPFPYQIIVRDGPSDKLAQTVDEINHLTLPPVQVLFLTTKKPDTTFFAEKAAFKWRAEQFLFYNETKEIDRAIQRYPTIYQMVIKPGIKLPRDLPADIKKITVKYGKPFSLVKFAAGYIVHNILFEQMNGNYGQEISVKIQNGNLKEYVINYESAKTYIDGLPG